MARFSISDFLNDPKKEASPDENTRAHKNIRLEDILPSENNKYRICDVEELAASIEMMGLIHPLAVRETGTPGKYELISGERRYTALKLLVGEGKEQFSTASCMVEGNGDPLVAELELLFANAMARDLTDYEKTYQAGRIKAIFLELKNKGYKFKGRMRQIVADILKVSPTQIGRMESINKNLVPEAQEEFKKGNLNITAAYETSRLPPEEQTGVLEGIWKEPTGRKRTCPKSIKSPSADQQKPIAVSNVKAERMIDPRRVLSFLRMAASGADTGIEMPELCRDAAVIVEQWVEEHGKNMIAVSAETGRGQS